ncbi:tyrosine-type recombinase/integrase [Pseudomonas sp. P154a]|uniref:tyrosine-type recombinase/integrase n=1 Tax=Pseudomonas mucoides TaxID=2730424 RepID=UPI001892813E|nr:tyrosine-type recombinase/integrase [Pseudomonas mucoides]MBF6039515.1 tyrosine-type recombinase/integrase [Pseudomonas mucoides]
MTTAKHLLTTLRTFHLDNPEATWDELRERLKEIAEDALATGSVWDREDMGLGQVYSDLRDDLLEIARTMPLTVPQAKAVSAGSRVLKAAEGRLQGDLHGLVSVIEEMNEDAIINSISRASPSLSVRAPNASLETQSTNDPQRTFRALADLYINERKGDLAPSTMKNIKSTCTVICTVLGELDLEHHTRADLVALREQLLEGRKPSTVNKVLTTLSTVLGWAVANAYISKSFDKKLQISKGTDSGRRAFSSDQIATLMAHANGLPASSWQRWALSLAVVTGARIGELHQLTSKDLIEDAQGVLVMDINTNEKKTTKNKFSVRKVPVVSAYGVDLKALKAFIEAADGRLFKMSSSGFTSMLNQLLRDVLGTEANTGRTFHSIRHHLSGAMKAAEVPAGTVQDILGHSSGTLAFDLYGSTRSVQMGRMVEALEKALSE